MEKPAAETCRVFTPSEYRHYFYCVRWCLQHNFSDEKIKNFTELTQVELDAFKKEVVECFGDERDKYL